MLWFQSVKQHSFRKMLAIISSALVAACSGGEGTQNTDQSASNNAWTSSGNISGFGSVIVNDIRYDDSTATITINDRLAVRREELRLGMIVDIEGNVDSTSISGTASKIAAHSFVKGPVSNIDATLRQFNIFGITVAVNNATVIQGAVNLEAISIGRTVEVYGFSDSGGNLVATRVEIEADDVNDNTVRLTGTVTDLTNTTFMLHGILVQYNPAATGNLRTALINGLRVRVSGSLTSNLNNKFTISAANIREISPYLSNRENQQIEIKGIITGFRSSTDFDVNGERVVVENNAELKGTFAIGVIVKVEGRVVNGRLIAREVEAKLLSELDDVDLTGMIENFNSQTQTFTLHNGNVAVRWTNTSEFDQSSLPQGAAGLANNMLIRIKGRIEGNVVIAERIRVPDNNGLEDRKSEGVVQNLNTSTRTFTIHNGRLTVQWDSRTSFEDLPQGGNSLTNGRKVEVEGILQGTTLLATRIEADQNDD